MQAIDGICNVGRCSLAAVDAAVATPTQLDAAEKTLPAAGIFSSLSSHISADTVLPISLPLLEFWQ